MRRSNGLLPTTKAGAGDKEPAFIILRTHACKFLALLILLSVLVGLKFYDNESQFENVKVKLHGVARTLHLSEVEHLKAHAEIAKVGEEFERHLDRDLHELEAGQKLLKTLKSTQQLFEQNISAIIENELKTARSSIESKSQETPSPPENAMIDLVLNNLENKLKTNLNEACSDLFTTQINTVNSLIRRLAEGAREAAERKEDLQGEIRHNLHETTQDNNAQNTGDDWWKNEEESFDNAEEDDHWARETEKWHNQTVDLFYEKLDSWLHPNSSDTKHELMAAYDTKTPLYEELHKAQEHIREDVASWRDIQDLIHSRKDDLAKFGLPSYTDADEPEDDGYQGFQSWHVQSYLDEALWPALLRSHLPQLEKMKLDMEAGETAPIDVVDVLEGMASDNVIPHHWLHHGGHEYYYGSRDDYY